MDKSEIKLIENFPRIHRHKQETFSVIYTDSLTFMIWNFSFFQLPYEFLLSECKWLSTMQLIAFDNQL